ncbi:EaA protein [Salmonella phage SETP7]|uniref:EaA protein n=1 Tax=Salmonella phage SETP7 TaxID=424947 RepID=U5N3N0_9CAUD|nr:EaA protein [Salmonella phage SETP7]AGX84717.1 EaA protein [Salmonella phage SETP7]
MTTNTNNKLTDERPDDEGLEFLITIRREIAERHASEGRMAQSAVHTLILNALLELQERRKDDNQEPVPVVPEECPAELPYAQVKAVTDLYALCWQSGEVVTYTPDPEKAIIWLNNYSGTCIQEYVKLERLQQRHA